jgi:hypothetical protein
MGNAYPVSRDRTQGVGSSSVGKDAGWDTDIESLLEENARLRALVVKLSDLVLRNVVDQK